MSGSPPVHDLHLFCGQRYSVPLCINALREARLAPCYQSDLYVGHKPRLHTYLPHLFLHLCGSCLGCLSILQPTVVLVALFSCPAWFLVSPCSHALFPCIWAT